MTVIQQIVYTDEPQRWWALAEALGFRAAYPPSPEWSEFEAGGILAVHHATGELRPGGCDLHLLVPDLDHAARALAGFETTRAEMEGVGEVLTVRAGSGLTITASAGSPAPRQGEIAMQPIWFQDDVAEARAILEALGLRADVVADRGGWVEFASDGGSIGVHSGDPRIGLGFLASGDLDALAERLADAGFPASVVDEAWARTVRVVDPDGGDEIWINGVQQDLYGYRRVSVATR